MIFSLLEEDDHITIIQDDETLKEMPEDETTDRGTLTITTRFNGQGNSWRVLANEHVIAIITADTLKQTIISAVLTVLNGVKP